MIAIACDHGGYTLKEAVKAHLTDKGVQVQDFGCNSLDSCDYADFGVPAARAVAAGTCEKGILICTTGIGMSMAANKVRGIRCGVCTNVFSAEMTRRHNNANMLALGAGIVAEDLAMEIVDKFLETPFDGGRHQRRIDKVMAVENE